MEYDCIIVGGGIAGLQAAIQLGRYMHTVLVIDKGEGRSTICRSYHNLLGWPEGISGNQLRYLGKLQAERLNVTFMLDEVIFIDKLSSGFTVKVKQADVAPFQTRCILIATGVMDRIPDLPGLLPFLGKSIYVCPDCDGYEVLSKKTIVLGAGDTGANMALTLLYWTRQLIYINHDRAEVSPDKLQKLVTKGIIYIEQAAKEIVVENGVDFRGVRLSDGTLVDGERGFLAFGGNEVHSSLVQGLGVERLENRHIVTDPRTKMTNISNVWAAGDIGVHSEQVTIAMGEGSQAAIWIHKALMKMRGQ